MPKNTIGAAALAVISAVALAGCAGSRTADRPTPPARSVPVPLGAAQPAAASGTGASIAVPAAATTVAPAGQTQASAGTSQYAGMSQSDWNAIDQALSDSESALSQSDADAAHNH